MDNDSREGHAKVTHGELVQNEALQRRLKGESYKEISIALDIPEDTLRKWFAPSYNRHDLASLVDEQLDELNKDSLRLLRANVLSVTESLIHEALNGNVRAMTEVLDRSSMASHSLYNKKLHDEDFKVIIVSAKQEVQELELARQKLLETKK